ncbi:VCBS repeat-containing protein [Sinimarinibacterium sp. NLF-5-8]|uniref:VCBS repeat-containing protein n=1 Tax=Sinimarinibacterium sp. NLF-5-8 TaxID=2698684 RepID=UPI00137BB45D|nr:VCBS repeat-containing protein [Sinimarinibacterium sp. NLF-5-8]QHS09457.1 VCBS repeat-containing protein [Sinimarinibacterium sp. NLF-5-8]
MHITQSQLALASTHLVQRSESTTETLRLWTGETRPDFENQGSRLARADNGGSTLTLSAQAQQIARHISAGLSLGSARAPAEKSARDAAEQTRTDAASNAEDAQGNGIEQNYQFLISLVETLTGRKMNLFNARELTHSPANAPPPGNTTNNARAEGQQPARAGWGLEYDAVHTLSESENTQFLAQGVVKTADGKTINFSLTLDMARSFYQESSISIRAGDGIRKDPLIINYAGTAAELSDTRFEFDLDADGQSDNIAFLRPGSGFLVFDRNSNGQVDDGRELFGTQSGNGFADLAAFDADDNGWIDAADAIFDQLKIWTRDDQGNDSLRALADYNIGAISLAHASTPFDLKDASNNLQGQILSSGVFLREDGSVGSVQQLDLVV